MPLTFSNAITIAQMELNYLARFSRGLALVPEEARETPYGWLIPWTLAEMRFVRGYEGVCLAGNAPFFIDRFTGQVSRPSFYDEWDEWLRHYAATHGYSDEGT